jgi:hypothetical protein
MRTSMIVSLCLVVAACSSGSSSSGIPDAQPATADASALVTVITLVDGVPSSNVDVLFQDRSGAIVHHAKSDAEGHATFALENGGMVTMFVVDDTGGASTTNHLLETITGVAPGDVVTLGRIRPPYQPDMQAMIHVTIAAAFPGASTYDVRFGG